MTEKIECKVKDAKCCLIENVQNFQKPLSLLQNHANRIKAISIE